MKSRDIVREIFDNVSSPVLLIDRNYKIAEANRAALSHVRHSGPDVVGRSCFKITHASDKPCWHTGEVDCPVKDAFEAGKRVHTIHRHWIRDQLVIEEIIATPLDEENGEVNFVIEEFRDITELLELREGILPICASCKRFEARRAAGTAARSTFTITRGGFLPFIVPGVFPPAISRMSKRAPWTGSRSPLPHAPWRIEAVDRRGDVRRLRRVAHVAVVTSARHVLDLPVFLHHPDHRFVGSALSHDRRLEVAFRKRHVVHPGGVSG